MKALTIFSFAIKYLKDHLLDALTKQAKRYYTASFLIELSVIFKGVKSTNLHFIHSIAKYIVRWLNVARYQ